MSHTIAGLWPMFVLLCSLGMLSACGDGVSHSSGAQADTGSGEANDGAAAGNDGNSSDSGATAQDVPDGASSGSEDSSSDSSSAGSGGDTAADASSGSADGSSDVPSPEPGRRLLLRDSLVQNDASIRFLIDVFDSAGVPVMGLQGSDFRIEENAVPLDPAESGLEVVGKEWLDFSYHTVMLVDVSNSMPALDQVQNTLTRFFSGLSVPDRFFARQTLSLIAFDDSSRTLQEQTRSAAHLQQAAAALRYRGVGSTNLYGALAQAASTIRLADRVDDTAMGALVMITDGVDTAGILSAARVAQVARGRPIYIIDVEPDSAVASELRELASGIVQIDSVSQLRAALDQVWTAMEVQAGARYLVRYVSPKRRALDGRLQSNHQATLRVNNGSASQGAVSINFNASQFSQGAPELLVDSERSAVVGQQMDVAARVLFSGSSNTQGQFDWSTAGNCNITPVTANGSRVLLRLLAAGSCRVTVIYSDIMLDFDASKSFSVQVEEAPF